MYFNRKTSNKSLVIDTCKYIMEHTWQQNMRSFVVGLMEHIVFIKFVGGKKSNLTPHHTCIVF